MVIISRTFCNTDKITDVEDVRNVFRKGVTAIRQMESTMSLLKPEDFNNNHNAVCEAVYKIVRG